jgi:glycosyltransferase involved in cell wall biosynthesis
MQLKKICFVLETNTDVRMIEGLAEHFDLTLLHRQSDRSLISQATSVSFSDVVGPRSRIGFARFVINYLRNSRSQFDFVIVQGYGIAALAVNIAAKVTRIPPTAMLVCSPLEAYYLCRKQHAVSGKPYRHYELLGIRAFAFANALLGQQYIVLSQYLGDNVHQYGIKKPTSQISIYGVDTNLFVPPTLSKIEIKAKLGLPTTGFLIFFSSRIAPEKDSETLLMAFQSLVAEGHDLRLLHRSGGFKEFMEDAKRYGIEDRVIATDAVHPHKQLPLDYQACDLCIQSSRQEGLGFSPLESLACGTPVIASAIGGLKETIIDGHTGWTYPVGDSGKLAACIQEVIANSEEAGKRAMAGREMVKEKYDRQLVFNQLLEIVRNTKTP